ncbi:MAG: phosphotyrosine protein phosphatase [Lachnospiraceae bacterium]|nr:phosphotyrosine protein phosphatase [Lachnospiraceae bacterium]
MRTVNRIIFTGKTATSRAPMAAAIFGEITRGKRIEVLSRGLVVLFQEPLNQKIEAVMISNGLEPEGILSGQLEEEDFTEDTLVVALAYEIKEKIIDKYEKANEENVVELTSFVGEELEIINPYGGNLKQYGLCYESMYKSLQKLVEKLEL